MSPQTQKAPDGATFNGIDTAAMGQTIGTLRREPTLARFEFRATNQWLGGTMSRSSIQGFFGAGAEDRSRAHPFKVVSGEPAVLLGHNEGPNPGEYLLHAFASCVTTTTVLHAAARGIRVDSISSEVAGDVDLQGVLGLDAKVPPRFSQIRMKVKIEADCSDQELDELLKFVYEHSTVGDTIRHPVPVLFERVR